MKKRMEGIYHLLSSQAVPFTLNANVNSSESSLKEKEDIETTCKGILCQAQCCSLEDLCNAANSDMIANNDGHESLNSCLALDLSANTVQSHNVTSIATEIELFSKCDSSLMESRVDCCKEKFIDRNTCEYCGKVCAKPSILQKHIRAHTNERPFPCSKCDMHFKTKSNLYKHCKSRTHLNQAGHTSLLKGATDDISSEKPQIHFVSSQASDAYENVSNSCDGHDDVNTNNCKNSFPSQILILDKNEGGKAVWKLLKDIPGAPSSSVAISQECNKAIIEKSSQTSNEGFKPLVKSFSEKSSSKLMQPSKPHSYSFSNDADLKQIPKLDKTMTNDDIQRRISLIISINNSIVDTPKEIKNHRLKKVVRNYSENNNYISTGLDSFNSKSTTRANSITPTFDLDKVVSTSQSSLSIVSRSTNFLSVPSNLPMQSLILEKTLSDKQNAYSNKFHQLSLPTTSFDNVEHLKHLKKANSFADSCAATISNVSSSFCLTTFPSQPNYKHFEMLGVPGENILVHENNQSDSKSIDEFNSSFISSGESLYQTSPFISPRSSPLSQSLFNDQQCKHKRGRPKGSKNKLKALPTSSSSVVHSIIPLIQITSAEDTTKECHWRKELKRHILMKRSLSNENPVEKELQPVSLSILPSSSCAVSSSSIQQLSLSSMPIKKRRKTLTELGRGTAFGTTVDDNLETTSARKSLVKPLWSSDGSFKANATVEDSACYQSNAQKRKFNQSDSLSISSCAEITCIQKSLESSNVVCNSECFSNSHPSIISHEKILGHEEAMPKSCISYSSSKLSSGNYNFSASLGNNMLALNVQNDLGKISNQCVLIPTQYITKAADSANATSSSSQNLSNFIMLSCPPIVQNTKVANSLINSTTSTTQSSFLTESVNTDSKKLTVKKSFDVINSDKISDVVSSHQNFQMKCRKLVLHPKYKKIDLDFGSDQNDFSNIDNTSSLHAEYSSNSQSSTSDSGSGKGTSAVEESVRDVLDSEAAASLLDLSKSRQIPDSSLHSFQGHQNINMHNLSSSLNVNEILDSSTLSRSSCQSSTTTNKRCVPLSLANCLLKADYFPNVSCLSSSLTNKVSCSITSKNVGFIEGKHTCSICQKVFSKEHYLVLHKNIHYMEKPHRCCKCQATFQTKWLLKRHLNMVHHLAKPCDPRPFKCVECRKAFRTRGHLTKHARSKLHSQKLTSSSSRNANRYECHHSSDANNGEADNLKVENGKTIISPVSRKTCCVNDKKTQCANYSFVTFQGETHSDNVGRLHLQEPSCLLSQNSDKHSNNDEEPLNSQISVVMNCGYEEQNGDIMASGDSNFFLSNIDNQLRLNQIPGRLKKLSILGKACQVSEEPRELNTNAIETFDNASENLSSCNIPLGVVFSMNENQNTNKYILPVSVIERVRGEITHKIQSEGVQTFPCHVCHVEFQDMQLLLIHYKCHLEQRTHICTVCDAGFKDIESLISHTNSHSKKFWSCKSTQTINHHESGDLGANFSCSQPVSPQRADTVKQSVNFPKFNRSKLHHSQIEALSFRKLPASCLSSQAARISGGIMSSVSIPNPIIHVSGLPPGLIVYGDTEGVSDRSVGTSEVLSSIDLTGDPIAHLLLNRTVRNNKPSLFPDTTYSLPCSQLSGSSESDIVTNSNNNVYLYCQEGGYFLLANADSFATSLLQTKSLS